MIDPAFRTAALNTLEFAGLTTVCSLVLGGGFAVLCFRTDVPGRRLYARLFIAPIMLPPLGLILGWNALYGPGGYAHDFVTQTLRVPLNLTSVPGMAVLGTAVAVPVAPVLLLDWALPATSARLSAAMTLCTALALAAFVAFATHGWRRDQSGYEVRYG